MKKYILLFFLLHFYTALKGQQSDFGELSLDSLLNIKVTSVSKYKQTSSEAPASVTIITSRDIELFGYKTLLDALASVRSLYTSYDRAYGYIGVRGFGRPTDYNNRVLILINGRTTNENFYGSSFPDACLAMNMQSIDRIEIVRGPGSVIYGTGAMFAVVNIVTKQPEQINNLEASASVGSYGTYRGQFTAGNSFGYSKNFFISGIASHSGGANQFYSEFNSPENNNGVTEKTDWENYFGIFSSLSFENFNFQAQYGYRGKGIPTASYETIFNDTRYKIYDQYGFAELAYNNSLPDDKSLTLKAFLNYYNYKGFYPYPDNILQRDHNTNIGIGLEGQFKWNIASDNSFIAGFEFRRQLQADYILWDDSTTYFNKDFPFNSFSFYLNDEWQLLNNLSLTVGIRNEYYSNNESNLVPRAALIFNPFKQSTLKFLYGEAYRVPNLYEKYYEDFDLTKANPNLIPEKIRTIEFVAEQKLSGELLGLISFYNNDINNLIDLVLDTSDNFVQEQNIGKVHSYGLEAEINYINKNGMKGYLNYCYQITRDAGLDITLSNSPTLILRAGLIIPFSKILFASFDGHYESKRRTLWDNNTKAFFVMNTTISMLNIFKNLSLYFSINNLFNENYTYPVGYEHIQPVIKQDGRNFQLRISYSL